MKMIILLERMARGKSTKRHIRYIYIPLLPGVCRVKRMIMIWSMISSLQIFFSPTPGKKKKVFGPLCDSLCVPVVKVGPTKNLLDCVRGWGSGSDPGWHSFCDFCSTAKAETAAWASEPAFKPLALISSVSSRIPSSVPANSFWSRPPLWSRCRHLPSRRATRGTSLVGPWTLSRSCGGTCHTKCMTGSVLSFHYFRGEGDICWWRCQTVQSLSVFYED